MAATPCGDGGVVEEIQAVVFEPIFESRGPRGRQDVERRPEVGVRIEVI